MGVFVFPLHLMPRDKRRSSANSLVLLAKSGMVRLNIGLDIVLLFQFTAATGLIHNSGWKYSYTICLETYSMVSKSFSITRHFLLVTQDKQKWLGHRFTKYQVILLFQKFLMSMSVALSGSREDRINSKHNNLRWRTLFDKKGNCCLSSLQKPKNSLCLSPDKYRRHHSEKQSSSQMRVFSTVIACKLWQ